MASLEEQFIGPQPAPGPRLPQVQGPVTVQNAPQSTSTMQVDPRIKQAQTFLSQASFNPGPIDGILGPKTMAGISAFQQAQGVPVTGQLDQATNQAIANFQFDPVPMPEINAVVDVSQLEQPTMSPFQPAVPTRQNMIDQELARAESFVNTLQPTLDQFREQQSGITQQIQQLLGGAGATERQTAIEDQLGVRGIENQLAELSGQIQQEIAGIRATQQTLSDEGAMRSTAGLTRRQEQAQQQGTNRILGLQAAATVLQGNLDSARNYASRMAQIQSDQQRSQLEAAMFNLDQVQRQAESIGDDITARQAEARQFQLQQQMAILDEQTNEKQQAIELALSAIPRGANSQAVAEFISGNPTIDQAIAQFGEAMQTPTAMEALEIQGAKADIALANERLRGAQLENDQYARELSDLIGGSVKLVKNEEEASRIVGEIININDMITHEKMGNAVGIARNRPIFKSESYRDFTNAVDNFIANKTFTELKEQKAGGATFGALSDGELSLIATAATIIGNARQERNGKTTGYAMSEEAFVNELQTVENYMKVDAIRRGVSPESLGAVVTIDGVFVQDLSDPESLIRLPIELQ